jgi:glucans biosynthesis protein
VGEAERHVSGPRTKLRRFVVDFAPEKPASLPSDEREKRSASIEPVITVSRGLVLDPVAMINRETGGYRLVFDFRPDNSDAVEMRGFIRQGNATLTETWSYLWSP